MRIKNFTIKQSIFLLTVLSISATAYFTIDYYNSVISVFELTDSPREFKLHGRDYIERDVLTTYEDLSEQTINAIIVSEDPDFYNHPDTEITKCFTLPIKYLLRPESTRNLDGETLVSQIVRIRYIKNTNPPDYSQFKDYMDRCLTVSSLENNYDKKDIIEVYVNENYFMIKYRGLRRASKSLFQKDPNELSLAESVVIVALRQFPKEQYSYQNNLENSEDRPLWQVRSEYVLEGMLKEGYITQDEMEKAKTEISEISLIK